MVPLEVAEQVGDTEREGQPSKEYDHSDLPVGGGERGQLLVPPGSHDAQNAPMARSVTATHSDPISQVANHSPNPNLNPSFMLKGYPLHFVSAKDSTWRGRARRRAGCRPSRRGPPGVEDVGRGDWPTRLICGALARICKGQTVSSRHESCGRPRLSGHVRKEAT